MKHSVSAFVMAALLAFAVNASAKKPAKVYTNANVNGGYGCNVAGTLGGAGVVGTMQFHANGDGTFIEGQLTLQIGGVGVCQYSLESGMGTYDLTPHGTGSAHEVYSLLTGSASGCSSTFDSHLSLVCSGIVNTDRCDIATLDSGILLSGTCKAQNDYK